MKHHFDKAKEKAGSLSPDGLLVVHQRLLQFPLLLQHTRKVRMGSSKLWEDLGNKETELRHAGMAVTTSDSRRRLYKGTLTSLLRFFPASPSLLLLRS